MMAKVFQPQMHTDEKELKDFYVWFYQKSAFICFYLW